MKVNKISEPFQTVEDNNYTMLKYQSKYSCLMGYSIKVKQKV